MPDDTETMPPAASDDQTAETQQPADTSAPAQEDQAATESTTSGEAAGDAAKTPDAEPAEAPATEAVDLTIGIEMMLYEAGMIANSLSSKSLGSALADKLYEQEQVAEGKQENKFTFDFTPFEAGMALGAMSRSADGSLDELQQRLGSALAEKMEELGVAGIGGDQGGSLGGSLGGV